MKKIFKAVFTLIAVLLSIGVIYSMGFRTVFFILNNQLIKNEQQVNFSETGKGITWIKPENEKTLFFIPSSKELATESLYGPWLKLIHEELSVNIIVPPFDIEGITPVLRGEQSSTKRKSSSVDFLFKLYREQMGKDHSIMILSTGDGSLQALQLARQHQSIDKIVLISPIHNTFERQGSTIFHKLAGFPLYQFLIPWIPEYYGKMRAGGFDIFNDNLNEQFQNRYGKFYPAYLNLAYERKLKLEIEKQMMNLSEVSPNRLFIIYGDDDLSYGLEGFERMGDVLTDGGSEVSIIRVPQSGRMILFDNGKDRIKELVGILLQ